MNKLTSRDLLLSVVAMSDPLFFNKSLSKFPLTFPPPNKPYSTQRPSRARLLMFCSQKELPTQSRITSAPFPEEITKIPKNLNTSSILPECKGLAPLQIVQLTVLLVYHYGIQFIISVFSLAECCRKHLVEFSYIIREERWRGRGRGPERAVFDTRHTVVD